MLGISIPPFSGEFIDDVFYTLCSNQSRIIPMLLEEISWFLALQIGLPELIFELGRKSDLFG